MLRRFAITLITVIASLTGCAESNKTGAEKLGSTGRIDTPSGMIQYLERQNLPALKAVEVWENNYGPGLKVTTAHYEILTTLLEPLMLPQVPGFVESAYQGYQDQLPNPVETTAKSTVYLFAKRQQWEDFTKTFAGPQTPLCKPGVRAYYLNGVCVAYNSGREQTFANLGHEGWHQFTSRHFRFRLPTWLDEGIAMLFEIGRYDQGLFYFELAKNMQRLGSLKMAMMKDRMIPLRKLVALNPAEMFAVNDDEAVGAFYGQSYALVRFLREADYGKRLGNYHQMLLDGLRGRWELSEVDKRIAADRNIPLTIVWNRNVGPEIFKQYIGEDFEQIEQAYIKFCRKIVYSVRFK